MHAITVQRALEENGFGRLPKAAPPIPQDLRTPGEQRDPPPPRTNVQIKALPQQYNMAEAANQAVENYTKAIEKKPPPPLLPQPQEAQMILREAPPPQIDVRNIQAPPSKKAPPTQPMETESTESRTNKAPPPVLETRENEITTPENGTIPKASAKEKPSPNNRNTIRKYTKISGKHSIKYSKNRTGDRDAKSTDIKYARNRTTTNSKGTRNK